MKNFLRAILVAVAIIASGVGVLRLLRPWLSYQRLMIGGGVIFAVAGVIVVGFAVRSLASAFDVDERRRGRKLMFQGLFYIAAGAGWLWVSQWLFRP